MLSRWFSPLALLTLVGGSAGAADIFPEVYGVAQFSQPFGRPTDLIDFGTVLPGGGRYFNFGQFSHGGSPCTAYTGQSEYLCASASARVDIVRQLLATPTYIGIATSVLLKAQVHLDYRNASATSGQIWARARISIPLQCNSVVAPPVAGLRVRYRLDGEYQVSVSDRAVVVKAPRPFETCNNAVCTLQVPTFRCPMEPGATTVLTVELYPIVQIDNSAGRIGYSVLAVSDYSHTFTLEGMDALDADGRPLPDVRLVVPGDNGAFNDVFLTGAEAEEVAAATSTTTTTTTTTTSASATTTTSVTGATSTSTTATSTSVSTTTSSTVAPCATRDLAAASCRCARRPVPGCDAVTLRPPVEKGLNTLCAKIALAETTSAKKQRRSAKQAAAVARKTLRVVNGRKGEAIPGACREGLRTFLDATAADVATAIR